MMASGAKRHMRARGGSSDGHVGIGESPLIMARASQPDEAREPNSRLNVWPLSGPLQYRRMTDFALIAAIRRINREA